MAARNIAAKARAAVNQPIVAPLGLAVTSHHALAGGS
jgi:hypothetical protein